jgi:hypothetical protein
VVAVENPSEIKEEKVEEEVVAVESPIEANL